VLAPAYDTFGEAGRPHPRLGQLRRRGHRQHQGRGASRTAAIGVQTIRPAVDVRRSALAVHGIEAADLVGGQIVFGVTAWRIKTVIENGLELRLIVMQDE
jgi:hypothetical protein